jgi:hypothetical protein
MEPQGFGPRVQTGAKIVIPNPTASDAISNIQPMKSVLLIPRTPADGC